VGKSVYPFSNLVKEIGDQNQITWASEP